MHGSSNAIAWSSQSSGKARKQGLTTVAALPSATGSHPSLESGSGSSPKLASDMTVASDNSHQDEVLHAVQPRARTATLPPVMVSHELRPVLELFA